MPHNTAPHASRCTQGVTGATVGPGAAAIRLEVNGIVRALAVLPSETLAEVLRERLALTGTKIACDRGACSSCTVWVDGAPVCSCMVLAIEVDGHRVTSIEGLAGEALHPVQSAFIEHDAIQCGFCTPGLVMSCVALLETHPHPTEEEVKAAIGGHLCRCGTYPHVIAAVLDVARKGKRSP